MPGQNTDITEEKRLFYVAATRAKNNLFMSYCKFREGQNAKMSQFLTEINADLLPRCQDAKLLKDQRKAQIRKQKQTTLF